MSRILVIGGTGNIGQHLVTASLNAGHRTAVLVRPTTVAPDSDKAKLLNSLEARGVSVVYVRAYHSITSLQLTVYTVYICTLGNRGAVKLGDVNCARMQGDMNDHGSLVAAIKQHREVVISAVGHGRPEELDGQIKIVQAIKEAGDVKVHAQKPSSTTCITKIVAFSFFLELRVYDKRFLLFPLEKGFGVTSHFPLIFLRVCLF